MALTTISKRFSFDSTHILPFHEGKCKNLHGHTYIVFVELTGEILENGMVMDFGDLKAMVKPIIDSMDHALIVGPDTPTEVLLMANSMAYKTYSMPGPSTAEYIASHICSLVGLKLISKVLTEEIEPNVSFITVRVHETPDSYAEITEEIPWDDLEGGDSEDLDLEATLEGLTEMLDELAEMATVFDDLDDPELQELMERLKVDEQEPSFEDASTSVWWEPESSGEASSADWLGAFGTEEEQDESEG